MVKKIVGYNEQGKIVFEREAREYDKTIANTAFGVSLGDIVKAVPIIFLCGIIYAGQQNFNERILKNVNDNSQAIGGMKEALSNLNNYLSSATGKQFKDGRPISYQPIREVIEG